jgi:hypothetical protein
MGKNGMCFLLVLSLLLLSQLLGPFLPQVCLQL